MQVEITSVEVQLGKDKLKLKVEDARELHRQLSALFALPVKEVEKQYIAVPVPAYPPPIIIEYPNPAPIYPGLPQIWCEGPTCGNGITNCLSATAIIEIK